MSSDLSKAKLQLGQVPGLSREEYSEIQTLENWKQNENRCKELMGKGISAEPVH